MIGDGASHLVIKRRSAGLVRTLAAAAVMCASTVATPQGDSHSGAASGPTEVCLSGDPANTLTCLMTVGKNLLTEINDDDTRGEVLLDLIGAANSARIDDEELRNATAAYLLGKSTKVATRSDLSIELRYYQLRIGKEGLPPSQDEVRQAVQRATESSPIDEILGGIYPVCLTRRFSDADRGEWKALRRSFCRLPEAKQIAIEDEFPGLGVALSALVKAEQPGKPFLESLTMALDKATEILEVAQDETIPAEGREELLSLSALVAVVAADAALEAGEKKAARYGVALALRNASGMDGETGNATRLAVIGAVLPVLALLREIETLGRLAEYSARRIDAREADVTVRSLLIYGLVAAVAALQDPAVSAPTLNRQPINQSTPVGNG